MMNTRKAITNMKNMMAINSLKNKGSQIRPKKKKS